MLWPDAKNTFDHLLLSAVFATPIYNPDVLPQLQ
jgi:hypothetical protein